MVPKWRLMMKDNAYRLLFPYCLQRRGADGAYVALNRKYKPLGFMTNDWVQYEAHPIGFRFARLPPATIKALSWNRSEEPGAIFLYSDARAPFHHSKADTVAYLERLERLGKLLLHAVPVPVTG